MLFKQRFHAGIRDGSITRTFRAWDSPRVKAGGTYRLGGEVGLEVTGVDEVPLGKITLADARRSGFESPEALALELRKTTEKRLTARSKVYRVSFRWRAAADPREALRKDTSAAALDEVGERLERMDRRSARGPWTMDLLRLIQARPEVSASVLSQDVGRERRAFKADVRKLKELGLTISHGVGYSLSKRGAALLARRG